MVMISLKEDNLTTLSWILTHRGIIGQYEMMSETIMIILKKLKKASKKASNRRYIQDKIETFIDFYPLSGHKKRVKP